MTRREDGYATIMVVSILLGLSIIAVAVLGKASASALKGEKVSNRILLDAAIEGVFHQTVAGIINGTLQVTSNQQESVNRVLDRQAYIFITSETDKINLNRAPIDDIRHALGAAISDPVTSSALLSEIEDARGKDTTVINSLDDLIDADMDSEGVACLRSKFTTFHTASPSAAAFSGQASLDGVILRIKIETRDSDQLNRGIDAAILLTGNREDPAWTMDWRRYTAPELETCPT